MLFFFVCAKISAREAVIIAPVFFFFFAFILQLAHLHEFFHFKIVCRQQYFTCYKKFNGSKFKIMLEIFSPQKYEKIQFLS